MHGIHRVRSRVQLQSVNHSSLRSVLTRPPADVTLWASALFTALFSIVSIAHLIQAILGRKWFMLGTVFICAVTETLGWSARTWSALSTEWQSELGGYWNSNQTAFL